MVFVLVVLALATVAAVAFVLREETRLELLPRAGRDQGGDGVVKFVVCGGWKEEEKEKDEKCGGGRCVRVFWLCLCGGGTNEKRKKRKEKEIRCGFCPVLLSKAGESSRCPSPLHSC